MQNLHHSKPDLTQIATVVGDAGQLIAPLYTAEERERRDQTIWTQIQGFLAIAQFLVFLVSLALVATYLISGQFLWAATVSILLKTGVLLTIMVTGSIWEKVVFGRFLFAPAFFWEDVVSMAVISAHLGYVAMIVLHIGTPTEQIYVALVAYALYVINAVQFLLKFRQARLSAAPTSASQSNAQKSLGGER